MNEEEFSEANKVIPAKCVQLKKDGHAKVHQKPPIADADLKELYERGVFSTDFPKTLLNIVFFRNNALLLPSSLPKSASAKKV